MDVLTLAATLLLSALPTLIADAQTSRTRRRAAATALVPAGTQLRIRLNDTLSSKESRAGDRFTATVVNPSRYEEGKGMSMKEGSKRASAKSLKGGKSGPYVVPETAIRDFIGSLSIGDVEITATRLQIVADVTHREIDSQVDLLDRSHMRLLGSLASESTNKDYRRIMRAIIAVVGQGPRGIDAAHLTASYAVELAFRWTPDYVSSLKQYGDKLRTTRLPRRVGSRRQRPGYRDRRCLQRVLQG